MKLVIVWIVISIYTHPYLGWVDRLHLIPRDINIVN